MEKSNTLFDWYSGGISDGWIDLYEKELIRFLESEYGELTDLEKLVTVFTSQFLKAGHVSLPIDQSPLEWADHLGLDGEASSWLADEKIDYSELEKSRLIGRGKEEKPFIQHGDQISVRRFFMYENRIAEWISSKNEKLYSLSSEFPFPYFHSLFEDETEKPNWQKVAVAMSLFKPFLIVSGGPGTGKTTTVAKILAIKLMSRDEPIRIALAAPTGKAAGRMAESLNREIERLNVPEEKRSQLPEDAATLHRLLYGLDRGGLLPDLEKKKLRYDLIIVDEASMIDLNLMHRLISHIGERTQLILLGDKDQLASVEAGSVFADLCQKPENGFTKETIGLLKKIMPETAIPLKEQTLLNDSVLYLTKSYRFDSDSGIGKLAALVKAGIADADKMNSVIDESTELSHEVFDFSREKLEKLAGNLAAKVKEAQNVKEKRALLQFWKRTAWLTVLRRGPEGSKELNRLVERILVLQRAIQPENGWYHGRPIIITRNNYSLGIFNGDMGVCLRDEDGRLQIYVESGSDIKMLRPGRLTDFAPAYFLTVHKSQGSEFNHVNLLLPKRDTSILTRELLYTAITRARKRFTLYGSTDLFVEGSNRQTERFTGLKNLVG